MEFKLKTIYLLSILLLNSCSGGEKTPEQVYKIPISEMKSLDLYGSGLSSQFPFKTVPLIGDENKFLISHTLSRSIDTVFLDSKAGHIKKGMDIPLEGPNGIESFNNFFPIDNGFLFVDDASIYRPVDGIFNRLLFGKSLLGIEKDLSIIRNSRAPQVISSNSNLSEIYFFSDNFYTEATFLVQFNLKKDSFSEMPFSPLGKMKNHIIKFGHQNGDKMAKVNNDYKPDLFITNVGCIIYYSFCADFQFFNFSSKKTKIIEPESRLFKSEKREPVANLGEMDLAKFLKISNNWNMDIEFGPIMALEKKLFFRIVRSGLIDQKESKFLELFNSSLEKIQEINLSDFESDLSFFYFPLGESIFIKASDQPNEDVLNYYLIRCGDK